LKLKPQTSNLKPKNQQGVDGFILNLASDMLEF